MKKLTVAAIFLNLFLLSILFLSSCTYSVTNTMAHTQGTATDLIDDTQSQTSTADISPTISIPPTII